MSNRILYRFGFLLKNKKLMLIALRRQIDSCPVANTHCLHELFCPECPFGWLPVIGGRQK